jgi:hypothetical protein
MNCPVSQLPRYVTLHHLSQRTGIHRGRLALLMARGELTPAAMQEMGNGRETFLFPAGAIGRLNHPASSPLPL